MRTDIDALQDHRQADGDREPNVFEVQRFTRQQNECGETAGWRRWSGWFQRASGLEWAWFRREVNDDGEATESE